MRRFYGLVFGLFILGMTAAPAQAQRQRTWIGCPDQILYERHVVLGTSRPVDLSGGRTLWGATCQGDGRRFPIRRVKDGCGWAPDPLRWVARREEREVYTNATGEEVEVVPCALYDDAESVPLRLTTAGCRIRNDFEMGVTSGETRAVFDVPEDGAGAPPHEAQSCAERRDAPLTWPHKVSACTPPATVAVNGVGRWSWSQIAIESDPPRVIRSCQPDPDPALRVTTDGCDGLYVHDLASATSYGTRRWYQVTVSTDGGESFGGWVTGCVQDPDVTYQHVTVYTGWRNDDAARTSTRIADTVVDTPTGRIVLETGVSRERPKDYQLGEDRPPRDDGSPVAIGCELWQPRRHIGVVTRGDGSQLEIDRGPLPAVLVRACPK